MIFITSYYVMVKTKLWRFSSYIRLNESNKRNQVGVWGLGVGGLGVWGFGGLGVWGFGGLGDLRPHIYILIVYIITYPDN